MILKTSKRTLLTLFIRNLLQTYQLNRLLPTILSQNLFSKFSETYPKLPPPPLDGRGGGPPKLPPPPRAWPPKPPEKNFII